VRDTVDSIVPLLLTYNEAPNIARTLAKLTWACEVLLVDSCSDDGTIELARAVPRIQILRRAFDSHTAQWNFGVDQAGSDWILSLDADYVLGDELVRELHDWTPRSGVVAYFASFRYCIAGRPLRGSLYPPRAVLFDRRFCRYEADGHTQKLKINGKTGELKGIIYHDDRKPLSRWLWAQDRYTQLEVQKLLSSPCSSLTLQDRIRTKIIVAPILVFFYTLIWKRLILDGWPGWYYVFQRTLAEIMLSLRLLEARFGKCDR
jgi:glycosyltransferase involved in cell wall biosynthesis